MRKYYVVKPDTNICSLDKTTNVIIHKFSMGKRVCKCTKVTVEEKITGGGGWRRTPKTVPKQEESKSE